MNIDILKNRKPAIDGLSEFKKYGICIPLIYEEDYISGWEKNSDVFTTGHGEGLGENRIRDLELRSELFPKVLFEVRRKDLRRQPGDICFPGGRIENGELPEEGAIRELCEELKVPKADVELLGASDIFLSGDGSAIYPYAVRLRNYRGSFSEDEVEEVFTVPLAFFMETKPERYIVECVQTPGEDFPFEKIHAGRDYEWGNKINEVFFYEYEGRNIWGMSARFIRTFCRIIKDANGI